MARLPASEEEADELVGMLEIRVQGDRSRLASAERKLARARQHLASLRASGTQQETGE